MAAPAHAGRMLFVNIPVADVERSKAFFARLGFSYNPMFTDETAACMLVGEQASVMLLSHETFAQFSKLPMADPATHALALYCFSVSARDEVDTVAEAALAAGGTEADGPEDHGFMYTRSFFDLDGHGWQVMWMDPAAAEQGPEAFAASMQDAEAPARPFPGIGETLLGEDDQHRGCVGVPYNSSRCAEGREMGLNSRGASTIGDA